MNPFRNIGPLELLLLLAAILLLFGPGRIGKVAGELGEGIRNFRRGISGEDEGVEEEEAESKE